MRKRILVISWFFPPINSSEGLVTFKLLNNSKYEYDVYTQHNNESWSYGQSDDIILGKNIRRIDSDAKDLNEFKKEAIDYFYENLDKYDIVMTRSMPEVSHIIGLEIKKIKPNIKWIASFGDPIGNNPFTLKVIKYCNPYSLDQRYVRHMGLKEIISPFRILRSLRYKMNYKKREKFFIEDNNELQKEIINKCDYIIFNNKFQQSYMLQDYKNKEDLIKKAVVLYHSYDNSLYKKIKHRNEKIVFTYVGSLDDVRSPHELFVALNRLNELDPELEDKVEFYFYGSMSDNEKLYLLNNDLLSFVRIKKNIDYLKSLEVMQKADWLILIDANISDITDQNIFFAAKLADYIGSKKRIFGITMLDGASSEILKEYNSLCLENNAEEILNYLYLIIYEGFSKKLNFDYAERFDAVTVACKFDELIGSIKGR